MAKPKEKSPAFQLYVKEWLSCPHVMRMLPEQEGAYIHLLCVCWIEDGLLDDIAVLVHLSRISEDKLKFVLEKFTTHPRKNGWLTHPRLEKERKKQKAYKRKQSKSGKAGARKRWEGARAQGDTKPKKDSTANGGATKVPLSNDSSAFTITSTITIPLNIYMARIGAMMGMGANEQWNPKEIKGLEKLGSIPEIDLDLMQKYYEAQLPEGRDYRSTTLEALLRDWKKQLDRARRHNRSRVKPEAKELVEPDQWHKAWAIKLGTDNFEHEWDNLLRETKIEITQHINRQ